MDLRAWSSNGDESGPWEASGLWSPTVSTKLNENYTNKMGVRALIYKCLQMEEKDLQGHEAWDQPKLYKNSTKSLRKLYATLRNLNHNLHLV